MQHSSSTSVNSILKILHSLHLLLLVTISLHHRVEHFVGLQLCLHSILQKECIPNEICSCPISKQEHIDLQVHRFMQRPFPVQLISYQQFIYLSFLAVAFMSRHTLLCIRTITAFTINPIICRSITRCQVKL